jgi:hypothetical protein
MFFFAIIKRNCHLHIQKTFPFNNNFNSLNNNGYQSCEDCIFYLSPNVYNFTDSKCKRFIKQNLDTGDKEFASNNICRSHLDLCGPEAKAKVINNP